MNANDSLERGIADVYEREAPQRAPDWVLASVLDTVDKTPQRRVLIPAPWRIHPMNSFAKLAIAAVVVIAIGALGLSVLGPRSPSGVGGQPSASPSLSQSPSPATTPDPSAPPPLSSTFTSTIHGYSIAYPARWAIHTATEPWTGGGVNFGEPQGDVLYDETLRDHLFLLMVSRPLGGQSAEAWIESIRNDPDGGCADPETLAVDGADARLCSTYAYTSAGDRAYMIRLYTSGDEAWLEQYYDPTWFKSVLETVQLEPDSAVDTPASPSASPSS